MAGGEGGLLIILVDRLEIGIINEGGLRWLRFLKNIFSGFCFGSRHVKWYARHGGYTLTGKGNVPGLMACACFDNAPARGLMYRARCRRLRGQCPIALARAHIRVDYDLLISRCLLLKNCLITVGQLQPLRALHPGKLQAISICPFTVYVCFCAGIFRGLYCGGFLKFKVSAVGTGLHPKLKFFRCNLFDA